MAGETVVTIIGNLTADPELAFIANGTARARFTVASTPRQYDREGGQWKDGEALFLSCTAWRELAEHVTESLRRGNRVIVQGRLKLSRWETPEGEKRQAYNLEVDEIGPSLKFAEAKVSKAQRSKNGAGDGFAPDTVPADPWNSNKVAVGQEGF